MKAFVLIILFTTAIFFVRAQTSDLLVLKKEGRTIRSFFPGSDIQFNTDTRYYDAVIRYINHDSLFLVQYDIRQVPTSIGLVMLDTVATYPFSINYKEIVALGKTGDKNFNWSGSGGALLGGGTLIAIVGMGTWIFTKPNTQYYASPYLVGGAALVAGIGYLLAKSSGKKMTLGEKYTLEYIPVK